MITQACKCVPRHWKYDGNGKTDKAGTMSHIWFCTFHQVHCCHLVNDKMPFSMSNTTLRTPQRQYERPWRAQCSQTQSNQKSDREGRGVAAYTETTNITQIISLNKLKLKKYWKKKHRIGNLLKISCTNQYSWYSSIACWKQKYIWIWIPKCFKTKNVQTGGHKHSISNQHLP